jgi:hypothetical protein
MLQSIPVTQDVLSWYTVTGAPVTEVTTKTPPVAPISAVTSTNTNTNVNNSASNNTTSKTTNSKTFTSELFRDLMFNAPQVPA